jgi:hypothetical protein
MTDYKVIDNFLPSDVFDPLHAALLLPHLAGNFGAGYPQWRYTPNVNKMKEMEHLLGNDPNNNCSQEQVEQATIDLKNIITKEGNDWRLFYFIHMVYDYTILSPFYEVIKPYRKPFDIKALIRIKINMYPNAETLKEHGMHYDYDYSHKAAILSINTCDGYTKLEDGTKIDSVANRMLLFDGQTLHTSSNTTDQTARININFNYF